MRRLIMLAMLTSLGCLPSTPPVTVAVSAKNPAEVDWIAVRAFDVHGQIAEHTAAPTAFPYTFSFANIDPKDVRIAVEGRGAASTHAGARFDGKSALALTLGGDVVDSDGEGIIDDIDDCPLVADLDQKNTRGSGPGDACAPVLGSTPDSPNPIEGGGSDDMGTTPPAPGDMAGGGGNSTGSVCDPTKTTLCEGFEGANIDATRWSTSINTGSAVSLDRTHVFRGTQALKIHAAALTSGTYGEVALINRSLFPANDLFVRAFVYVPAGYPGNPAALFAMGQSATPFHATGLQLDTGMLGTFDELPTPAIYKGPTGSVGTDKWVCLEWEVKLGATGAINVWLDGTLVTALSGTQNLTASPAVGELHLGVAAQAAANIAARDLWIDEVGVGSARIGCGT